MGLYRCSSGSSGGGSGIDILSAIADGNFTEKNTSSQTAITVSTPNGKPKYILVVTTRNSNGATRILFVDVDNNTGNGRKNYGSGYQEAVDIDSVSSITDSGFSYTSFTSSAAYNWFFWWY